MSFSDYLYDFPLSTYYNVQSVWNSYQKVSFYNIASEASYTRFKLEVIWIFSRQKSTVESASIITSIFDDFSNIVEL